MLASVLSRKEEKRSSWIDFRDSLVSPDSDGSEGDIIIDGQNDQYGVRDRLDADDGFLGDTSELRDVLDRLAPGSEESGYSGGGGGGRELARSRSSEALKQTVHLDHHHPPVQNGYAWDDVTLGDRTSRWSGSIYSRMSIMDEEESNTARDRFVKRVEAMLAEGGGEPTQNNTIAALGADDQTELGVARQNSRRGPERDRYIIPPVPKIPDEFAGSTRRAEAGRLWNRF